MDKPCLGTSLWGMLETKTLNSSKSTGSKIRINARPRSSLNQFYHQGLCNGDCAGPLSTCHISPYTGLSPLCSQILSGPTIVWVLAMRQCLITQHSRENQP